MGAKENLHANTFPRGGESSVNQFGSCVHFAIAAALKVLIRYIGPQNVPRR